jgi:membrane protease YdiL (CAAX protease family)
LFQFVPPESLVGNPELIESFIADYTFTHPSVFNILLAAIYSIFVLIVSVRLSYTAFVIADSNSSLIESIKKSWSITKGNFWRILFFPLSFILWIIPGVLLTVALLGLIIMAINKQGLSSSEWSLLLLVGITTLLVGFSEEVMFRGIALRGALTSKGLFTSMLFSAVTFSLLHSVNILGGAPVGGVLVQLVLTFIFGFFMAPIALKLQSLIPLIIFHFLWDFSLFVAPMVSVDTKFMMYFFLPIEILFSIILWISMRKESVESVKI